VGRGWLTKGGGMCGRAAVTPGRASFRCGDGVRSKTAEEAKTPTNIDEAGSALLRDTGGIRSILLGRFD